MTKNSMVDENGLDTAEANDPKLTLLWAIIFIVGMIGYILIERHVFEKNCIEAKEISWRTPDECRSFFKKLDLEATIRRSNE